MKTIASRLSKMIALAFLALAFVPLQAQIRDSALSEAEIEQVRNQRYIPSDCVLLFVKFLDLRTQEIHDLYARPRRPGREQDTHDLLEQFTSIADELSDNLDDYGPRHMDLRKALPKIIDATERWSSALKSPPDDEAYNVARKVALESIRDLRESATELASSQAIWFKAHPPAKAQDQHNAPPIDIPRNPHRWSRCGDNFGYPGKAPLGGTPRGVVVLSDCGRAIYDFSSLQICHSNTVRVKYLQTHELRLLVTDINRYLWCDGLLLPDVRSDWKRLPKAFSDVRTGPGTSDALLFL